MVPVFSWEWGSDPVPKPSERTLFGVGAQAPRTKRACTVPPALGYENKARPPGGSPGPGWGNTSRILLSFTRGGTAPWAALLCLHSLLHLQDLCGLKMPSEVTLGDRVRCGGC